jgi:hypothetical protein
MFPRVTWIIYGLSLGLKVFGAMMICMYPKDSKVSGIGESTLMRIKAFLISPYTPEIAASLSPQNQSEVTEITPLTRL